MKNGHQNPPDTSPAELPITPEIATPIVGTFEVQGVALHQPLDLQPDPGVDEVVEVSARVLERERVRVGEALADGEVYLRGEIVERGYKCTAVHGTVAVTATVTAIVTVTATVTFKRRPV